MITKLTVSNLRNITELSLQPISGINLILGENGSGKTSVLEAIHLLAMGRSFRTRSLKNAVQFDQQQLQITANTSNDTRLACSMIKAPAYKFGLTEHH